MALFAFLFAFVGAVVVSCSSNDDEDSGSLSGNEDLVGYWIRYEDNDQLMEEIAFFADGTCNYEESYEPDDSSEDSEFEFAEGTYTVNEDKLRMKLKFNDETEIWTYTIKSVVKNKKLVLTDEDGDSYTFDYFKK